MPAQPQSACKKRVHLAEVFSTDIPYDKNGPRWQAIKDVVTHYMAKDMVLIYTVDKKAFIKTLRTMHDIFLYFSFVKSN